MLALVPRLSEDNDTSTHKIKNQLKTTYCQISLQQSFIKLKYFNQITKIDSCKNTESETQSAECGL
jgi:hypothetical protein